MEEFLLVEKYRPRTVSECILPDRLKKVFQDFVNTGNIPNLMLTGPAGVGKTTIAKAMCSELGLSHLFVNASKDRGIDDLRTTIIEYAGTMSFTGGRKVIILDEADYLTADAQAALRGTIEQYSKNCTFILTCNFKSRLIDALHSRCSIIDFTLKSNEKPSMAAQFYKRMEYILKKENIPYEPNALAKLVEKYFPDYRRTLNEIQRFAAFGGIDASVVAQVQDVKKLTELMSHLKSKDFSGMRKWVALNHDVEPTRMFRKVYDSLYSSLEPNSIPQAVLIIAKYQYQSAFVADQEINTVAMLTEMMVECAFK